MTTEEFAEVMGNAISKGILRSVCTFCVWALIALMVWSAASGMLSIGLDETDKDGWTRSGLKLHTDYATGVQYLESPGGGLTPRLGVKKEAPHD